MMDQPHYEALPIEMDTDSSEAAQAGRGGVHRLCLQQQEELQALSSKLHSFYSPGGSCSFPERVTSLRVVGRPRQRQRWNDKQMLPVSIMRVQNTHGLISTYAISYPVPNSS